MSAQVPAEVVALAERRAAARAAKDFAAADTLRDQIRDIGWEVTDGPGGFALAPLEPEVAGPLAPSDVASLLDQPAGFDVSVHWVCEGWLDDINRGLASLRANAGGRRVQFVVADITGDAQARFKDADDVEVVWVAPDTGWAAARNAGLRRSLAPIVVALDGSIEATGDIYGSLASALEDPSLGVCGPFGIVTRDLRQFEESPDPGPCDAVEGYLLAFRREVFVAVGGFDEKFRWYRTADIEWSFRVKDAGLRCAVVPVPVAKHEHRMWASATEEQRVAWSKRNFYRFLDRWRDRWDLVLAGEPDHHDHDPDHDLDGPVALPEGR